MGKIENMKIICIRQPGYLPNIGFFQKMEASDVFVYLDDTRYGSEKWDNRNKIRSDTGSMFLTVPIVKKTIKSLNQILISENEDWQKKHLGGIFLNYKKTPYFENYWPTLKQILEKKWNKLYELNLELINWIKNELKIETETILSSELKIDETSNLKLLKICEKLGATTYLSGKMGKDYLDEKEFQRKNIKIIYENYEHPKYKQIQEDFLPNMSVIDLLFNQGENAAKIIKKSIKET